MVVKPGQRLPGRGGFASITAMSASTSPDSGALSLVLPDSAATQALGARLAGFAAPGLFVALDGGLGAGKTTLARGFIRAWTGRPDEDAPSPTFTLVQIYDGPRGAVWHLDLYRLKTADEIDELGLEEAMDDAVCLVEWAQRLGARAPSPRLELRLLLAPEGRIAQIAYVGGAPPEWMGQLR